MPVFDFLKDSSKKHIPNKRLEEIPIAQIVPNPRQPRRIFDDESIEELAQSISQVGLMQPLLVRQTEGGYELIAGERRLRACKKLNMATVPCIVQNNIEEEESAVMALIENLQRENLHYLEEAECYSDLLNTYGLKQEELAARLGKSQSSIANKLRLLKLPAEIKAEMVKTQLTERHARALLSISDPKLQMELIKKVVEGNLSVKDTEKLVQKTLDKLYDTRSKGAKPRPMIIRMVKDYRLFMNTINTAVNQLRESGIRVELEQFDRPDGVDISIRVTRI